MGGASSKAARRLPTTTPSAIRSVDAHIPPPEPLPSSNPSPSSASSASGLAADHGSAKGVAAPKESPRGLGPNVHRNQPFSGEKDDAIRRDALDPHFASNLSQLGPVYVPHSSRATPAPALAQLTLAARQSQSEEGTGIPSQAGSLDAATLSELLNRLQGASEKEGAAICAQFGVDHAQMQRLRRWIAAPTKQM